MQRHQQITILLFQEQCNPIITGDASAIGPHKVTKTIYHWSQISYQSAYNSGHYYHAKNVFYHSKIALPML